ncbi:pentatricopeptide repeat-containing protein At4g21065-like [Neltuma alba]|uniref:pentatricopeptide repeat-containing protein At4g21065-like n=1 Tax=Neltuma alba TaxID=207710 RepID=UPI0010A4FAC8|nr:pentatricopeptide repeat-containing protein At4g21065-like [Prosopis alba]
MSQALQLHARVLKLGNTQTSESQKILSNIFTFSALSAAGDLNHARLILKSNPSLNSYFYNTIIRAYSWSSDPTHPSQALSLFLSMLHGPSHNMPGPDKFTFPFVLKCCVRLNLTPQGEQIHGLIAKMGLSSDLHIGNSLIYMYSEFGEVGNAYDVFDRMSKRDVVSWTSMIDGLVDNDRPAEAIKKFEEMLESGIEVNDATVVSVLRACAEMGALSVGKTVHKIVKERKLHYKGNVMTALLDMYAKCGCIESAWQVFNGDIMDRDVFVWTAMISGLASHGKCKEAIDLFYEMEASKIKPDEKTMTAVLSACRNAGSIPQCYKFFSSIQKRYGIRPTIQHYGCIVDLLARVGRLKEAEEFINKMPIKPDAILWRTLIWACNIHGDTTRIKRLMKHLGLQEMDADDSGSFILASNVYASEGKWCKKAKARELMKQKGLVKPAGCSRIEVEGVIHEFLMGDYNHSEAKNIYFKLNEMVDKLRKEGYYPKVSEVLLEGDDQEKANQLLHHSEKLALAFGLIRTSPGSEIRIVKNLRSCDDCHEFMKLVSRVYQRDIIVRDRIRFHQFKNGDCSCKNYW